MMKYIYIILILFSFITCKNSNNKIKIKKDTIIEVDNKNKAEKLDIRNNKTLIFTDLDSLNITTNFFTNKKIDSISSYTKEFKAKYYYCGKGNINIKLFDKLKIINNKDYNSLKSINTAHNIIINDDTLYICGRKNIKCYENKDSIKVKSTIYHIGYQNNYINFLIIDKINKIN